MICAADCTLYPPGGRTDIFNRTIARERFPRPIFCYASIPRVPLPGYPLEATILNPRTVQYKKRFSSTGNLAIFTHEQIKYKLKAIGTDKKV